MNFVKNSGLMRPIYFLKLMLGFCCVVSVVPSYAGVVIINGFPVDTEVHLPFNPSDESECDALKDDARQTAETLDKAHNQCLENNQGKGRSTEGEVRLPAGRRVTRCTEPLCQGLHVAREEHRDKLATAYAQCMADVSKWRERRSAGVASGFEKNDEEAYAFRRMAKGPVEGLAKHIKTKIFAAIDQYFGDRSRFIQGGIKVSDATQFLMRAVQDVRGRCAEMKDASLLNACDENLVDAISAFPRKVPAQFRYDPSIELIQRSMIEKLQIITREMNRNLDHIQASMDEISVGSSMTQSPGRKSRRTPLIENK